MTITANDCKEAIDNMIAGWRGELRPIVLYYKWKQIAKKKTDAGILRVFVKYWFPGLVFHVLENNGVITSIEPYVLPECMHRVYGIADYDRERSRMYLKYIPALPQNLIVKE